MVVSRQTSTISSYSKLVKASLIGSTVAGVAFGIYLQVTGMIPVLASMLGSESLALGWILHMMISWIFGLGYGAMTMLSSRYYMLGVLHGVIIWVIGPLLVMPMMMGMGPMIGQMFAGEQLMSLVTHLAFSLILATVFRRLVRQQA